MKKSGRVSGTRISSGSLTSGRVSSGGGSSGSSRSSSSGNVKLSPTGMLVLFIIVVVIVGMYALLSVELPIVIAVFAASVLGIVVIGAVGKPELTPEDKLRESTITQFQIPNTKEALLEFAILATQKIQPVGVMAKMFTIDGKRQVWLNKVWSEKCNMIYTKARLAMKDDPGSLSEITRLMNQAGIKV